MSVDPLNLAAVSSLQDEWGLYPREWVSAIALQAFLEADHSRNDAIRLAIQYADSLLEKIERRTKQKPDKITVFIYYSALFMAPEIKKNKARSHVIDHAVSTALSLHERLQQSNH